jgi:hypothetical protein
MDVDESVPNADYLSKPLRYSEDGQVLYDAENNGVMMSWEGPLMVKHAEILLPTEGLSVLNVGFGLGLVDEAVRGVTQKQYTPLISSWLFFNNRVYLAMYYSSKSASLRATQSSRLTPMFTPTCSSLAGISALVLKSSLGDGKM